MQVSRACDRIQWVIVVQFLGENWHNQDYGKRCQPKRLRTIAIMVAILTIFMSDAECLLQKRGITINAISFLSGWNQNKEWVSIVYWDDNLS